MEDDKDTTDAETLMELASQAKELEERLKKTQASAVVLRARMLATKRSKENGGVPVPAFTFTPAGDTHNATKLAEEGKQAIDSPLPAITLAYLQPYHIIRRKWNLETDFPLPDHVEEAESDQQLIDQMDHEGHLRLFGLMADGEPWECSILYTNLMADGGITIGRDADYADIVLADPGISRRHICLELTDRGVVVTDENSTNGTFRNDVRLSPYDRQMVLNDGDVLGLAGMNLRVELL